MPRKSSCRIESLFFWLGDVLLPPLWKVAFQVSPESEDSVSLTTQADWINLSKQLSIGRLSPAEFLDKIGRAPGKPVTPPEFPSLLGTWKAADPRLLDLAEELVARFQLYLISDYPATWLEAAWQSSSLERVFSWDKVSFTEEMNVLEPDVQVIQKLAEAGIFHTGKSLLVDADPLRTLQAVQAGYDSTVFVDARRLRRDLGLWGVFQDTE